MGSWYKSHAPQETLGSSLTQPSVSLKSSVDQLEKQEIDGHHPPFCTVSVSNCTCLFSTCREAFLSSSCSSPHLTISYRSLTPCTQRRTLDPHIPTVPHPQDSRSRMTAAQGTVSEPQIPIPTAPPSSISIRRKHTHAERAWILNLNQLKSTVSPCYSTLIPRVT